MTNLATVARAQAQLSADILELTKALAAQSAGLRAEIVALRTALVGLAAAAPPAVREQLAANLSDLSIMALNVAADTIDDGQKADILEAGGKLAKHLMPG